MCRPWLSLAANVGKKFATKVVSKVKSGALINPCLQVRYRARVAGSLTISYEDGLLLLALWAKNNQTTLKLRNGMNNAAVYSKTVIRMVATGFLRQGDVFVFDNAAIHHYRESTTLGDYLWYEHGILITFLPTRAPELNPIEKMWNILMQHLKNVALLGPGQNHLHQAATAAAMLMNEFTHLDVQACYISSGYLSTF
jgi:hypothetical protein